MSIWAEKTVALADAAGRGVQYHFELDAGDLPRLGALVAQSREDATGGEAPEISVQGTFTFANHAEPKFIAVTGHIDACFGLVCQRCLELTVVRPALDVALAVVDPKTPEEDLEAVAADYERWDHAGDEWRLADAVDELILLDLPLVVMHEDRGDCGRLAREARFAGQAEKTQRPFAGLSALLGDKH